MTERWKSTQIAPGFTIAEWLGIRDHLEPDLYSDDWAKVIDAVRQRLRRRFLDPADLLLRDEEARDAFPDGLGFTVLAIDCLLIETICGYQDGQRTQARGTGKAFEMFLKRASQFKYVFDSGNRAADFTRAVRNGLLHDGETRSGWIVWQGRADGPLVDEWDDGILRLNRTGFHRALTDCIDGYFTDLRSASDSGAGLRRNLAKRVDQLCDESAPPRN